MTRTLSTVVGAAVWNLLGSAEGLQCNVGAGQTLLQRDSLSGRRGSDRDACSQRLI